jgi:hypothetical protein
MDSQHLQDWILNIYKIAFVAEQIQVQQEVLLEGPASVENSIRL